ncbi:DUF4184 family protein [Dyella terrae]|uniref:DUF4184 family protein n=1 Tax=Dyella terrae TaxID=522259 RepID=UPI001EFED97F|nr:DUF4184 family protein [Dyella terrae]ULU23212.1 Zinc dependent phospholipase C/S1-P1 nuclease [Dyella terrae]
MPFTVSHVAAVLPLRRHCSIDEFAALAIGSMMPDLRYFLPVLREHWPLPSHHLISLPLFCLPMGWLLWRWWRPLWTSTALVDGETPPLPAPWRVMLALTIGAFTHLAWDACTHANYGLGLYLPMLGQPLFWMNHSAISNANLLQYGSSLAGLLILAVAAWPVRQQLLRGLRTGVPISWLMVSLVVTAILAASLTFVFTWNPGEGTSQLRHTIRLTAWNGLSSPLLIVVAYPLVWRLRQYKTYGR